MKRIASSPDSARPRASFPPRPQPRRGVSPFLIGVDLIETGRRLAIVGPQRVVSRVRSERSRVSR